MSLFTRWSWLDDEPEIRVRVQTPPNWPDVGVLSCTCKFVLVYLYLSDSLSHLSEIQYAFYRDIKAKTVVKR